MSHLIISDVCISSKLDVTSFTRIPVFDVGLTISIIINMVAAFSFASQYVTRKKSADTIRRNSNLLPNHFNAFSEGFELFKESQKTYYLTDDKNLP